ncbi:uncharacterized protein [Henckelia pumila]|uniref:uncharacterized protein n=1 Tax=Henckelia pumila TaxID=405737 RepID=UPI003C6DBAB7
MSNELQRRFEEAVNAASIHLHLQELYGAQTRAERFTTVKALMTTRMREGTSVHEHGVRMIGYIERLVSLDMVLPHELLVDVLLLSLPDSFDGFVVNFNMNKIEATLEELVNMLTSFEGTMKKEKPVLLVGSSSRAKKWPKGKGKMTKVPFDGKVERAHDLLDLIHTDVCGQLSIGTKYGHTYFITFTDDYSRYGYVFLMKHKSESFERFKEFRNEVEKQLGDHVGHDIGCDPRNFKEAISDVDASQWIEAMQSEFDSMHSNQVWTLVDPPDGIFPIGMLQSTKVWLSSKFLMKDMGEASYILGIKIYRDRSKRMLGLTPATYIDTILRRFSMEESKRGHLPMCHEVSLSKSMCPKNDEEIEMMTRVPYASAIGSVMYGMISTRPDVAFALSVTSRYQANPGPMHWKAMKDILKYL